MKRRSEQGNEQSKQLGAARDLTREDVRKAPAPKLTTAGDLQLLTASQPLTLAIRKQLGSDEMLS